MDVWRELEAGLGSVGKIRMLRIMFDKPNQVFTKYALERETGLKPVGVRSDLKALIEIGWLRSISMIRKPTKSTWKIRL